MGSFACAYFWHYGDVGILRAALYELASHTAFVLDDCYDLIVDDREFVRLCDAAPRDDGW